MHKYLPTGWFGHGSTRAELKPQGYPDALWKEAVTSVSVAVGYELRTVYGNQKNLATGP